MQGNLFSVKGWGMLAYLVAHFRSLNVATDYDGERRVAVPVTEL